jgi:hypothetical protein
MLRRAIPLFIAACAPAVESSRDAAPGHDAVTSVPDAAPFADIVAAACYEPSLSGTVTADGPAEIQSCAIWNSASELQGMVTLTRSGDSLTMSFASGPVFTGTLSGTSVNLVYYHLHPFDDGCEWRATETLFGTYDPSSCVMSLSYSYRETVESGSACATPCSGDASFMLSVTPII